MNTLGWITVAWALILFCAIFVFAIVSFAENERRAAIRLLSLSLIIPLPFLLSVVISFPYQEYIEFILLIISLMIVIVLLIPTKKPYRKDDNPSSAYDERDNVFSRKRLVEGSALYKEYYSRNPDLKEIDEALKKLPGILGDGAAYYHKLMFPASRSVFNVVEILENHVDGKPAINKTKACDQEITGFLKGMAKYLGAHSVGVTEIKDYHWYSVLGRNRNYNQHVDNSHKYAIALSIEMDREMNMTAPGNLSVFETGNKYFLSAYLAVQMAEFIRSLGYSARAHIDGNYGLCVPLVAKDAGLGEIGRMSILMTPELGPRVRIAVVTTDLPLITDKRFIDPAIIDFCQRCKKCAETCPGKAIPFGERLDSDGIERWKLDAEACYKYWCTAGTDCGRCMSVCPYSHPDNFLHNLSRKLISNSGLFRRIAVPLDDFLYGRKPVPSKKTTFEG